MPLYAVVRIRGMSGVRPEVERTLYLLRLRRKFAASIYHDSVPGVLGMLRKAENWATWGEIDRETLILLLRRRGRILGDKPLTDEWVKEKLGLSGLEELADKLLSGELHYHKLEGLGVKPFFRLHPPRGSFKGSIKRHYGDKGELGYRGKAINELLKRMI
ncbi:MAG: 50S ribosomal protein L30 [Desulfurococcales archaeon]|nr:50S ribosomal protein L30 [Desulfurococcales archaeon]